MRSLNDLQPGAVVHGILAGQAVTLVSVKWYGSDTVEAVFKDAAGKAGTQLLFRSNELDLDLVTEGLPWSFDADGGLLRLVSEARRIRLAYLFDPFLAVHASVVDPLPHQITAVYDHMLTRQPLRFLLADDPGAGKTIMAGLLIKELMIRGDVRRCLVVCPGSLVEQWQDELYRRFNLPFEILSRERIEGARSGNIFDEVPLLITRLDRLARNDDYLAKLARTEWDLVIVDEAHKMSASYYGNEIKYTKRYRLGQQLSEIARHFLLMTATPHNGKEEDFQLFMALLDGDRFEGKFRDGVHTSDPSDLMRRMVKEKLVKFDGTPLFPERIAYTVPYRLSDLEAKLYEAVTAYVKEEFNRAEALQENGRKGTVGFALTVLQRRLASSPEAIHQSLKRRRERLERRLAEAQLLGRGQQLDLPDLPDIGEMTDLWESLDDADDLPADEWEQAEEALMDRATAARTAEELRTEIRMLAQLEALALTVRNSGTDRKWEELSGLLQHQDRMFDAQGNRRKLVIFTEHRDTLNYLTEKIRSLIGRPEAVVTIHGGIGREARRHTQEAFTQDPAVLILVATDAAGEGINLQRAHLMINYDLPWNPNRLEQRFGRIHRIGQSEVCHLWNLVAEETREGDVYLTLLRKLERERASLGGAVFDVLGMAIDGKRLRDLLIEAIRYGDRPDVRARLDMVVEDALDGERLRSLIEEQALARDSMDISQVQRIRQTMERMEARRLQPHYVSAFFKAAFQRLGGSMQERESGRYEITHVPAAIRERDRQIGLGGAGVLRRYERVCFEKQLIHLPGKPEAAFICPGHPLLDAVLDLILERHQGLLRQGAILVDPSDRGETLRALFYLEHTIQDGRTVADGSRRAISKRMHFVEVPLAQGDDHLGLGQAVNAGPAPYLDYEPLAPADQSLVRPLVEQLTAGQDLEGWAVAHAIATLVPRHVDEVSRERRPLIAKTVAAVKERLTREILYWDHRAADLRDQELAGKVNAKLNSQKARQRAEELEGRLHTRLAELADEDKLAPLAPVVTGGALIIPGGLLARLRGERDHTPALFARETKRVEEAGMMAVMAAERGLGYNPVDVSAQKVGYDVESSDPAHPDARLRFIEVKGRILGADTVTVSRNEIVSSFNQPEQWVLALVKVPPSPELAEDVYVREARVGYGPPPGCQVRYVRRPFTTQPDFNAVSVNYDLDGLWQKGSEPT
ncbi:MAG: DUF3883 domain-containing protein [Caldilineaceae bacterium]|nr:DUF3883 domain-containing protein [Caldilineaceae bacterium]MBP8106575.1 DUF3883 domain-containing protein [Caldilineaceae bacterium]MBP9071368.1 DUF3883 domain-containing protein [Caldilineaceae bacterium]